MGKPLKTQEELAQEKQAAVRFMQLVLPIDKLLVAYGRQSTAKQVVRNKESAQQQAIDLLDYALELGWPDTKRLLFIENQLADGTIKNASGRLRIDQRPGLQEVTRLIETGDVGAVLVRSIDRLFRDETMVAPVVFANLCEKYHVLILTPDDLYDFNNPKRDDLNRFILEAIKAKDYIKHHVKGVMLRMRTRKALRGEYIGGGVPTGLMLDTDRTLYVPNPVWAPVMARLLRRFRELDANFAEFRREIVGNPIFPDLPEDILQRTGTIHLTKVDGGYTVKSIGGLKAMLTSVALIGHMQYDGHLIKQTHPAIVDEEDFWYCYDRLSSTDIDGIKIARPHQPDRFNHASRVALLQGRRSTGEAVLTSPGKAVYVMPTGQENSYAYGIRDRRKLAINQDVTRINVAVLDALFVDHMLQRLEHERQWHQSIPARLHEEVQRSEGREGEKSAYEHFQALQHQQPVSLVSIPETIAEAQKALARLQRDYTVNFDLLTDKELRENRQDRLKLAKDIADMEKKQEDAKATARDTQEIQELVEDACATWADWSLEKRRKFIRMVTQSITLDTLADGWLVLTITWNPYLGFVTTDVATIWRQRGAGKVWTEEERSIVARYYSTAGRAWLLHQLPTRSWESIRAQAFQQGVQRPIKWNDSDLPAWVSESDKHIIDTYGLALHDPAQRVWWQVFMEMQHERATVRSRW